MLNGLLARKSGMTHVFAEDGTQSAVTVLEAGPCKVVQVRRPETDRYSAVQLAFGPRRRRPTKPEAGHFGKAGVAPVRHLREFRCEDVGDLKPGDTVGVDVLKDAVRVDVIAISKGHGFTGMVHRWHKTIGPKSHGSMSHRAPGSIGSSAYPSRVIKGKRMPGQHGNARITTVGLKVIRVDSERNLLLVRGSVPGPIGGLVVVHRSRKNK